jgi:hypothetical protein
MIDGTYSIFFANFTGLEGGEVATPTPQHGITITVPERLGARMHVLPFLGKESVVSGHQVDANMRFQLPTLDRGTVIWFSKSR